MMPISDPETYASGHFERVYKHAIAPAVVAAKYKPIRADEVNSTNFIVVDLLQRVIRSPLAICDLSARNPNVFFELGIRQAFDMPVVLIKDQRTERVFDIQGLRTIEYEDSLRVDSVAEFQERLKSAILETISPPENSINSLIKLLSVQRAEVAEAPQLSPDTQLLMSAIHDLGSRLGHLEATRRQLDPSESIETFYRTATDIKRVSQFLVSLPDKIYRALQTKAEIMKTSVGAVARETLTTYITENDEGHFETLAVTPMLGLQTRVPVRVEQSIGKELLRRASLAEISVSKYIARVLAHYAAA
jgi:predicted HicB family RNase H-like nuclease